MCLYGHLAKGLEPSHQILLSRILRKTARTQDDNRIRRGPGAVKEGDPYATTRMMRLYSCVEVDGAHGPQLLEREQEKDVVKEKVLHLRASAKANLQRSPSSSIY
jgi:hypothetical protein